MILESFVGGAIYGAEAILSAPIPGTGLNVAGGLGVAAVIGAGIWAARKGFEKVFSSEKA